MLGLFCRRFIGVFWVLFLGVAAQAGSVGVPIQADVGEVVRLDPTDGFDALPVEELTLEWSWDERPATSVAEFSALDVLRPSVTVDVAGRYVARLSLFGSDPETPAFETTVEFGTENLTPVAQARLRGVPSDVATLTLDASGSYDVGGDALTYQWSVAASPLGSTVTIADPSSPLTAITADMAGSYEIALVVQDDAGRDSVMDRVVFDYVASDDGGFAYRTAPVASARFEQLSALSGEAVQIDPYASSDIDGSVLVPDIALLVAPTGGSAEVSTDENALTSVVAGGDGDYLFGVSVADGLRSDQAHVLVQVGDDTVRPVARIAPVTTTMIDVPIVLDGTQSFDFNGDLIDHRWSLLFAPEGSSATVLNDAQPSAGLVPDVEGIYVVQLQVSDDHITSVPATLIIRVTNGLPLAEAGMDQLAGDLGVVDLDGVLSAGAGNLDYAWSVLGLNGDGIGATLDDATAAMPQVMFETRQSRFRDIIRTASVYHYKRSERDGYCSFDTRLPSDLADASASEPVSLTLHSRGRQDTSDGRFLVWEIENKKRYTRTAELRDASGAILGSYLVPGRVSIHVTTHDIGKSAIELWVDGVEVAATKAKNNPFNRNNPVCTGPGAGVVQLIVADETGVSLPDTVFIGNANLRPVLSRRDRQELISGEMVSFVGADHGADANGDMLTYSWSLISRPVGSMATLDMPVLTADSLTFEPDRVGVYLIQLGASDGALVAEPVVFEVEVINSAPVAVAADPADTFVGDVATLDGSASYDIDGDALTFNWVITTRPEGSLATLADPFGAVVTFTPDRRGDYVFELTVSDYEYSSEPVSVTLTAPNRAPVAALEGPSEADPGAESVFTAAGSADPDNDPLTYVFEVTSAPANADYVIVNLAEGEVEFAATTAGEYAIKVTVSDGLLEDSATQTISVSPRNTAPVLGDLRDTYTVELGLELMLTLTGFDTNSDAISFFANPLPLVEGMNLNANDGTLVFRPEAGQEGSYTFTVGVSDGTLTDTQEITVIVVPATAGETSIFGRVLDATTGAPLANMPVRLRDNALMTVTDATGGFSFGSLAGSGDQILVEPSAAGGPGGYASDTRFVTITENQSRDISPDILLTPLNDGCTTVVAGQDTVVTGDTSGVTVTIAADTIEDDTGAAYTGDICLGTLPQLFDHIGMPNGTNACQIYALDAPGATFTNGITITAPNQDFLPEGTALNLWQLPTSGARFSRIGSAGVDAGAATVSSSSERITSSSLFSFLPQPPSLQASADMATSMQMLTPFEGDMSQTYTLPTYTAFGQQQGISLAYHSSAANPNLIVAGDVTIGSDASLPELLSSHISIGGLSIAAQQDWTPRQGADGSTPALVGDALTLRQSMPVDGTGIPSGTHDYTFTAAAKYNCSTVSDAYDGNLFVHNQTQSPYGNGWSIDGLQKLVINDDGSATILDDDSITTFKPKPTITEFKGEPLEFPSDGSVGIAVADFLGDDKLDVVYAESGPGRINFIENSGDENFQLRLGPVVADGVTVPQTGQWAPNLIDIAQGDLNDDGLADVAYTAQREQILGVLENTYGLGFETTTKIENKKSWALGIADIDSDGYKDFIVLRFIGNFSVIMYLDIGYGGPNGLEFVQEYKRIFTPIPSQLLLGDVDNDGNLDIGIRTQRGVDFIFNEGNREYRYYRSSLGDSGTYLVGNYAKFIDANQDGKLDVLWSNTTDLQLFLNNDGRRFDPPVDIVRPADATGLVTIQVADADGDGVEDIIVQGRSSVYSYSSNGDGTFQPFKAGFVTYPIDDVEFADLNSDGSLDMISTSRFFARIHFSDPSASGEFVSGDGEFSELVRLDDGTWERVYKDGTKAVFDANGLQTAEVDRHGNRIEYTYGPDGRLATKTDQAGGVIAFTYDALGRLSAVTYPDGRVINFGFDDIGNLTEILEPNFSTVSFAFDENNRLISTTNQNGNATYYDYTDVGKLAGATMPDGSTVSNQVASSLGLVDGLGILNSTPMLFVKPEDRITTVTDRNGETTEIEVNMFGSIIRITDPLGRISTFDRGEDNLVFRIDRPSDTTATGRRIDLLDYDNNGNITSYTELVGTDLERTKSYTYQAEFNRVIAETDAGGFTTTYEYDDTGELIKTIDPLGGFEDITYADDGKMLSRADKNGNLTIFAYNDKRNLSRITYADGSITQMTYDDAGNTTIIAEASGTDIERRVQRIYDNMNRVTAMEITGADNLQIDGYIAYTYLPAGNLETVTDETGLVTTMAYDSMERLTSVDDPAEGLIQRSYNEAGEVVQHINGDGEIHTYDYDEISRLIKTVDPEGFEKSFAYDSRDNVTTVTDGRGGITTFTYDALDRMRDRTNPLGETIARGYDTRNNMTTLTREDGTVETASYDGLNRRTQVVTPDNTLTYAYDARGNLTEAADDDSRVIFTYDNRNRVATTTTDGTVGPQPQVTLSYTYDALDRRLTMSDSLGGTTQYAYDVEDRLSTLTAPWGTVYSFGYDGDGRRTSLTSTSGRNTTYGYTNGLLSALTHAQSGVTLTDLAYDYGPDGQLTAILDRLDPSKSKTIAYDDLNRLVQVAEGVPVSDGGTPVPVEDYAYDGEGTAPRPT